MRPIVALRHVDPAAWATALRAEYETAESVAAIASKHGVTVRTVYRWLAELGERDSGVRRTRTVYKVATDE